MSKINFGFEKIHQDEKENRVAGVFDSVAKNYDLMNDIMSFRLHRVWKRDLIKKVKKEKEKIILDLAGGTGDISISLAGHFKESIVF